MKIKSLLLILYISCIASKQESNIYYYHSKNRVLAVNFKQNNKCVIKNIFLCDDIEERYKEISIECTYTKKDSIIVLKNNICLSNDCVLPDFIDIPSQKSTHCSFLNDESKIQPKFHDERRYQSEYQKHGLIPNIDIDTIRIINHKLYLYKKTNNQSSVLIEFTLHAGESF